MAERLRIGCIGVAGYAGSLIQQFDRNVPLERGHLAAVDVSMSAPTEPIERILQRHGAARVRGIDELLKYQPHLDGLIVPTSIDSHRPFTERALAAGLAVHVEKPVAGTLQDARAMIAARDEAGRPVQVGFQDTWSTSVQWAKGRILDGAIGRVGRVALWATWPRPDSYYRRNDWAGRMKRNGAWVLDSPANNALSHQINLALYLTGDAPDASNVATAIEAELYRARPIENYDTCALKLQTAAGCELLILLTHACVEHHHPMIDFIGETGVLRRMHPGACELRRGGEVVDRVDDLPGEPHGPMLNQFLDRITGDADRSKCEIENAVEVTRVINAASQCATVRDVPAEHVYRHAPGENPDDTIAAVEGIEALFEHCFETFTLPSATGRAPWAQPPGRMDMRGYDTFEGVAE